ncbi:MAG: hypothetical protein JNG84_06355 [Archangium sp.]|nr:hypothetical protein [Archangium sp.]
MFARVAILALFVSCAPSSLGGGSGYVLGPTSSVAQQRCVDQQRTRISAQLTPLFTASDRAPGAVVETRADGVFITTIAGRVRTAHEGGTTFAAYPSLYFENRSYQVTITDSVATGGGQLVVQVDTAGDVSTFGTTSQLRAWKVYGTAGNTNAYSFHFNTGMDQVTLRQLTKTISRNDRLARPLSVGDVMEFELHFYLSGTDARDPNPIGTGGNSVYYSDTFRYRVGRGGLTPENFDDFLLTGPPASALLGGGTSVPYVATSEGAPIEPQHAFSQLALNVQPPRHQHYLEGRQNFHSATSNCVSCHLRNGRSTFPLRTTRTGNPLVGLGLLEAVDESVLLAGADEDDCDGDGISGRVRVVGQRVGRFGWKASWPSLADAVANQPEAPAFDERLVTYVRMLGITPQRDSSSPTVQLGAQRFADIGCARCHTPALSSGPNHPAVELRDQPIRPYSDLLLHDLGAALADDSGADDAAEWRTAPLWGLGLTQAVSGEVHLLHDGRASSVLEAIQLHGGEAESSRVAFDALEPADRDAVLTFLQSL